MQPSAKSDDERPYQTAGETDEASVLQVLWAGRERLIRGLDKAPLGETEPAFVFLPADPAL